MEMLRDTLKKAREKYSKMVEKEMGYRDNSNLLM